MQVKGILGAGLIAAMAAATVVPAHAAPVGMQGTGVLLPAQAESVQYYYGPGYRHHHHHGNNAGALIGGLAAGAIIGGAIAAGQANAAAQQQAQQGAAYCAQRFRSYDPSTGTYIAKGGVRRYCP